MPKKIGPKKRKKIAKKKERKRGREAEARAQLEAKSAAESKQTQKESEILGRQRIKRPERNPKRPNRFSGSSEPPIPPPQLLDAIHEFLLDYRYIKAAHGMRTDNQRRVGHSQDVWKWTSKGMPFLSDIFIQWKEQNPETVQAAAVERKRALEERERWKAETKEAKAQKKELKRKRRDMALEAAQLEVANDFKAVARMKQKMREAEREQQRLDGYTVSASENEDAEMPDAAATVQSNKALESGSESDDESGASDSDSEWESDDENEKPAKSAAKKKVGKAERSSDSESDSGSSDEEEKAPKPKVNGIVTAVKAEATTAGKDDSNSESSSASSTSENEADAPKPIVNGTASSTQRKPKKGAQSDSDSDSSSSSSENDAAAPKPKANGAAKATKAASSSSSSSSSSSDEEEPTVTTKASTSKKRKAASPSSSSSSARSSSESEGGAPLPKKSKLANGTPAKPATSAVAPTSDKKDGLGKGLYKPFSRIADNVQVDPRFASNDYVPYEYAQKAYDDLSVVKGRGFTKEKNKKKRGQGFHGGRIDIDSSRAVKFDD